jgi:hypothetical protein
MRSQRAHTIVNNRIAEAAKACLVLQQSWHRLCTTLTHPQGGRIFKRLVRLRLVRDSKLLMRRRAVRYPGGRSMRSTEKVVKARRRGNENHKGENASENSFGPGYGRNVYVIELRSKRMKPRV